MSKQSKPPAPQAEDRVVLFQEKSIRRVWQNKEWWFAVADVVAALTDSLDARQYIKKMRSRDPQLDANWGTTCTPLPLLAPDGKATQALEQVERELEGKRRGKKK